MVTCYDLALLIYTQTSVSITVKRKSYIKMLSSY